MSRKIDLDLLEDLIAKCEAKMASPFKKEEETAVVAVDEEEEDPEMEISDSGSDEEFSEEDIEMLMKKWKSLG